jgi:phage major head subunit gpT-like protein
MEVDLTSASTDLVDLGGVPLPTTNPKDVDTLIEKTQTVIPEDWTITMHISQNAIDDDQTGSLERNFMGVMPAFQRHINNLVFTWLNAGDGTTYGTGPDGLALFSGSHLWPGAKNTTAQDNVSAAALSLDNFNTVWVAAQQFVDDQSNYFNFNYNLLVCHPTSNVLAANITGNTQAMDTANREINPYAGSLTYITTPYFDTTAWVLVATGEQSKPIIVGIKKRPQLQRMWFDSQQDDGGIHYFQYHARYNLAYADWPVVTMGNT